MTTPSGEPHRAHPVSHRVNLLRRVPPELWPLAVVIGAGLGAACYAMGNKLFTDANVSGGRITEANKVAKDAVRVDAMRGRSGVTGDLVDSQKRVPPSYLSRSSPYSRAQLGGGVHSVRGTAATSASSSAKRRASSELSPW